MDIIFNPNPNEHLKKLKISKDDVIATIKRYDEISRKDIVGDGTLIIYLKLISDDYYILVDSLLQNKQLIVARFYKLYPELIKEISTKVPLKVLENFAIKFGCPVKAGLSSKNFVYDESFPLSDCEDPEKPVSGLFPKDHGVMINVMYQVRDDGGTQMVDIAIAYCIDTDDYIGYLNTKSKKFKFSD